MTQNITVLGDISRVARQLGTRLKEIIPRNILNLGNDLVNLESSE